jgi:hypothetical protein
MPDIESRHVLQAWHFLREFGVNPSDDVAPHVLGAVVTSRGVVYDVVVDGVALVM